MNNCPSHVDTVYYVSKYNLEFHNKKEAIEHYIKIGKQKGYFPNREMEVFYCKTMNFDYEYYKRKYCITGDYKVVKRHWKLYGSKEGHYVNHCEEIGEHTPFMCKCRIKNKTADKRYSEDCNKFTDVAESDQDSSYTDKDSLSDHYVFSEKTDTNPSKSNKKFIEKSKESESSKLSSSCPSPPDFSDSTKHHESEKEKKSNKSGPIPNLISDKLICDSDSNDLHKQIEIALDSEKLDTHNKTSTESKTISDDVAQSERTNNSTKKSSQSEYQSSSIKSNTDPSSSSLYIPESSRISSDSKSISISFNSNLSSSSDSKSSSTHSSSSSSSSNESKDSSSSSSDSYHHSSKSSGSSETSECKCSKCLLEKSQTQQYVRSDQTEESKTSKNSIYDSKSLASRYKSKINRYNMNTNQENKIIKTNKTNTESIDVSLIESDKHIKTITPVTLIKIEKECGGRDHDNAERDDSTSESSRTSTSTDLNEKVLQLNTVDNDSFEEDFIDDGYKIIYRAIEHEPKTSDDTKHRSENKKVEKVQVLSDNLSLNTSQNSHNPYNSHTSDTSSNCSCKDCMKEKNPVKKDLQIKKKVQIKEDTYSDSANSILVEDSAEDSVGDEDNTEDSVEDEGSAEDSTKHSTDDKDSVEDSIDSMDSIDSIDSVEKRTFIKIYTDLKQKLEIFDKFSETKNENSIHTPVLHNQVKEQTSGQSLERTLEHTLTLDEMKLQRIQEKLTKKQDMCSNDQTNRYIFDKHMEIVCQNMSNIKTYLNMCHIYLDTYTTILKQAYQCLSDICNPCNNYMVYNAARVKLCNMLKEAENTIKTSYCGDLPIFYNKGPNKKSPSSIKFPLLICTSETVNKFLVQNIGEEHVYFRIQLMKISLRHLKLEKYCFPSLSRHEKVTMNTSPIPPCNCPVGKTPSRDMYLEEDLVKCWDMNYHLKQFENALYKITMTKEILCNYSKLIEIKEELVLKIKIANAKSE